MAFNGRKISSQERRKERNAGSVWESAFSLHYNAPFRLFSGDFFVVVRVGIVRVLGDWRCNWFTGNRDGGDRDTRNRGRDRDELSASEIQRRSAFLRRFSARREPSAREESRRGCRFQTCSRRVCRKRVSSIVVIYRRQAR